jgi:hypothetical protein
VTGGLVTCTRQTILFPAESRNWPTPQSLRVLGAGMQNYLRQDRFRGAGQPWWLTWASAESSDVTEA